MAKRDKLLFIFRKNWAWLLWLLLFFAVYFYIQKDTENLLSQLYPKERLTMWHGMFCYLSNGLLVPVQYWIGLLLLCYQTAKEFTVPEVLFRYQSKHRWLKNIQTKLILRGLCAASLSFLLVAIGNAIRYGLPQSLSWGTYVMSSQPIPVILITSFLSRLIITCFAVYFYLMLLVYSNNCTISYLFAAVTLILSNLVLILTPQYMSFKLFAFSSCLSYTFFLSDVYLFNVILATISPTCIGGILLFLQKSALYKFPEKGWRKVC